MLRRMERGKRDGQGRRSGSARRATAPRRSRAPASAGAAATGPAPCGRRLRGPPGAVRLRRAPARRMDRSRRRSRSPQPPARTPSRSRRPRRPTRRSAARGRAVLAPEARSRLEARRARRPRGRAQGPPRPPPLAAVLRAAVGLPARRRGVARARRGARHRGSPFESAWRPQEALEPFTVDEVVRQVNRFDASPVRNRGRRHARLALTITTGDSADSQQINEVRWVVRLLEGGRLNPNSGVEGGACGALAGPPGEAARYTGVQDEQDILESGRFYDPNHPAGAFAAWPRYPGLMDRAQLPFEAAGLRGRATSRSATTTARCRATSTRWPRSKPSRAAASSRSATRASPGSRPRSRARRARSSCRPIPTAASPTGRPTRRCTRPASRPTRTAFATSTATS